MKLLIVTQVLDLNHPVLGFFHRWIEEFAKHCDSILVICLQEGSHNLPSNVKVLSLGKETGRGRLTYLYRFYKLIWIYRSEYDSVFVHMNQIYIILGGLLWRLLGKKIGLWYTHGHISKSLVWAEKMTHVVFTASADSFKLPSEKLVVTGHGIDTEHFFPIKNSAKDFDLVTVGRISSVKNLRSLMDVMVELNKDRVVSMQIVGSALNNNDLKYKSALQEYIKEKKLTALVQFSGLVTQINLPNVLNKCRVFVTAAQNGSLDKSILEAMAVGMPVISIAPGSVSLPLLEQQVDNVADFVTQLYNVLDNKTVIRLDHSAYIQKNHSLQSLIPKIISSLI